MKLVILGATGGSGLCIVKQALDDGHEVTAIVRNTAKLNDIQHEKFEAVVGDVFSAESLQPHFQGCDAVLSCLGSPSLIYSTTIYSAPMKAIVTAMRAAQIKRIIMMSTWHVKVDPEDDPGWFGRYVVRFVLNKPLADLAVMEKFLEEECQDIDFTVVKPPQLTDRPVSGKEVLFEIGRQFCVSGITMPRADVARFMLQNIKTEDQYKRVVSIGI